MGALELLDDWPVSTVAAAVVGPAGRGERSDGRVAVLAAHGDTTRRFRLASVTKPLVARAAQVAVEEGAFELDTPAGPPGSTVRHLLAHASGVAMQSGDAAKVAAELRQRHLPWVTAVDPRGDVSRQLGFRVVPAFAVIDADGRLRLPAVGYTTSLGMRLRLWWIRLAG